MESRAKLAGHAIHPMLITLPLGLLGTAVAAPAGEGCGIAPPPAPGRPGEDEANSR